MQCWQIMSRRREAGGRRCFCLRFRGCTGLYVAVRRIGDTDGPPHIEIMDGVAANRTACWCSRRSHTMLRCKRQRSVKPSTCPNRDLVIELTGSNSAAHQPVPDWGWCSATTPRTA